VAAADPLFIREFTLRGVCEMETEGTLSSAWDQHIASEFAAKSVDQALATMTADPYVNAVPLMIGARGRIELHTFYEHFLFAAAKSRRKC
jgi:hypothetical protein